MVSEFWRSDEDVVKASHIGIICLLLWTLVMITSSACFDLKIIPIYDSCVDSYQGPGFLFFLSPIYFLVIVPVTIYYDIALLLKARKWKRQVGPSQNMQKVTQGNGHILNEPAMKSTLLNIVYIPFFLLLLYTIFTSQTTGQEVYNKGLLIFLLVTTLKCPAIVFWTLKVNEANARIDREKNRQAEIEEARIKMAEIRAKRTQNLGPIDEVSNDPGFLDIGDIELIENIEDENVLKLSKEKEIPNISKGIDVGPHSFTGKGGGVPILVQIYNPKSTKHINFLGRQNSFSSDTIRAFNTPNEEQGPNSDNRTKNSILEMKEVEIEMAEFKVQTRKDLGQMDAARNTAGQLDSMDESSKDIEASNIEKNEAKNIAEVSGKEKGVSNISKGVCIGPHSLIGKDMGEPILVQKFNPKVTKHVSFLDRHSCLPGETKKALDRPNKEPGPHSRIRVESKKKRQVETFKEVEIKMAEIKVDERKKET